MHWRENRLQTIQQKQVALNTETETYKLNGSKRLWPGFSRNVDACAPFMHNNQSKKNVNYGLVQIESKFIPILMYLCFSDRLLNKHSAKTSKPRLLHREGKKNQHETEGGSK